MRRKKQADLLCREGVMDYRIKPQQGESVAVPQLVFSRLASADEVSVRVALYVLATGVTDAAAIARDLKLRSTHSAESALLWWAGAGLLESTAAAPAALAAPAPLSWQQIAAAARTDPMIANLVECAQNAFGRGLSHAEMEKLVRLYLQDGFDPEMMMLCISYLATRGKATLAALAHELKAWQAEGVENGEAADRYLKLLALRAERESTVCGLLHQSPEGLTLGARKTIARWYEEYGFDDSMIGEAVVQAGSGQDVWYLNGVLRKWHAKGLRNIHDVRGAGAVTSPESRNIRVDRAQPSGNDFLKNAIDRPRRLKRKD